MGTEDKAKGKAKRAAKKAWEACFGRFRGIEKMKFLFKVSQKDKICGASDSEEPDDDTEETE